MAPLASGTETTTIITESVIEENSDEANSEQPSPGTGESNGPSPTATVPLNMSISHNTTPSHRRGSQPGFVERTSYFPSHLMGENVLTTTPPAPQVERKSAYVGSSSNNTSQPGSRRASQSLWARSKSVAEAYVKPTSSEEHTRRRKESGGRQESIVIVNPSQTNAAEYARNMARYGARSSSIDVDNLEQTNFATSVPQSRSSSFSNNLRRVHTAQGPLQRRESASGQARREGNQWDRRLSVKEYFRPQVWADQGPKTPTYGNITPVVSSTDDSSRPSLDSKDAQGPNLAFQSPRKWVFAGPPSSGSHASPRFVRQYSIGDDVIGPVISRHRSSIAVIDKVAPQAGVYFRSRRIREVERDMSWLKHRKDPKKKWLTIIPLIGIILGLGVAAINVYFGVRSVPVHKYCMVYEDDFSSGLLDPSVWTYEVQVGGFGNGQFEETTTSDENVFIKDDMLHIVPTLQEATLLTTNNTLNLTQLGICTSDMWYNCVATTNTTNGTIINPVKSGRINTKKGANIKYGRVEVVAKLPQGNWLWPAIWMMPSESVYGAWPKSGEIDIAESRGNNWTYPIGGNNVISSTLHWGPDAANDAWWRTYGKQNSLRSTFSEQFHTFGLEWSEDYLYTYLDGRLLQIIYTKFNVPFWQRGNFPLAFPNGTAIVNPWSQTGNPATPFDQDFYLILNVAVGGTNGWFVDGKAGKPWVDESPTAMRDFWNAKDTWYPTWQNNNGPGMQVKSVKMWQQQGYNGCGDDAVDIS
ncbi:hypothetical protein PV10_02978 [Exophiala mesophila]|uniref:GH16 domain-containing protein n=1 Tax=Exophiala mesophila TaxID=212818 RepID=A0A0D2A8J8_EXOME|nr:uncharacterized protein PV10_02978 [Exophiala mesophila]KIV95308.1 hypothetical protein PV10_02978 [Exophiala mesophila]